MALIARLALVLTTPPMLSDDIWRYIHDGAMFSKGVNPYQYAPNEFSPEQLPVPQIAERINNPELVTIYQPVSQLIYVGLERAWSWCPGWWQKYDLDHDKLFRLGFVLFDMLLIVLILVWLREAGRSAWWAVTYAWHPLAISEVAGSGHQDVIGIAFLVASLWLAWRLRQEVSERFSRYRRLMAVIAGVCFGLALGVKPIVLPIALVLAWMLRKKPAIILYAAIATVITLLLIYLPFLFMDGGLTRLMETGENFIRRWAFNGSVYPLMNRMIKKPWLDGLVLLILLATLCRVTQQEKDNPARPAGVYLYASLLLSSTVHPWYLLWCLALVPMWFSLSFWVFTLTVTASYAAHLYDGYRVPGWVVVAQYIPVYALLAYELWMRNRSRTGLKTL
ncbi:MAG: hypothetical protein Kow00105_14150 [Phycisphaeraceae bacterium]